MKGGQVAKRCLIACLAALLLLGGLAFDALPGLPAAAAATYGAFNNVTQTLVIDPATQYECKRMLNGTLSFSWPEPNAYFDVIFIQDTSASFAPYITQVQAAMKDMVNMLTLSPEPSASSFPRDRVMFVNFGGSQGESYTYLDGTTSYTTYNLPFEVAATQLLYNGNGVIAAIDALDNNIIGDATPTIDAMRLAQTKYEETLAPTQHAYDNSEYALPDGTLKTRRTVYVLITDGLSDTSRYSNMPSGAMPAVSAPPPANKDVSYTWYDEALERQYFLYYWGSSTRSNQSYTAYNSTGGVIDNNARYYTFTDGGGTWYIKDPSHYYRDPLTGSWVHDYGFYRFPPGSNTLTRYDSMGGQDYMTQLNAMRTIATELKTTGGVLDATKDGPSYLVTGFWEPDLNLMSQADHFGYQYLSTVRPEAIQTMQDMAYSMGMFVTNNNIDTFVQQMMAAYTKAISPVFDQVDIAAFAGYDMKGFVLEKFDPAQNRWVQVSPGYQTSVTDAQILIDMSTQLPGTYRIFYTMEENVFHGTDSRANTIDLVYQGIRTALDDPATTADDLIIPGNTRTDCEISLSKTVKDHNLQEGADSDYLLLEDRLVHAYFDTQYAFTDKVNDAQNTVHLIDRIDPNLTVINAWVVAGNAMALADALDPAQYITSGANTYTVNGVPAPIIADTASGVVINGNTVSYSVPMHEVETPDGQGYYLYGGLSGMSYYLVVEVALNPVLTDAQIDQMIQTKAADGLPIGAPNVSELILDSGRVTQQVVRSNMARVVPPEIVRPDIRKGVRLIGMVGPGLNDLNLASKTAPFEFVISLLMPMDTSAYKTLSITDTLNETLRAAAGLPAKVILTGADGIPQDVTAYFNITTSSVLEGGFTRQRVTAELITADPAAVRTLMDMAENSVLSLVIPTEIVPGSDLARYYYDATHRVQIPNIGSYVLNGFTPITSNTANVSPPTETLDVQKVVSGTTTPLANAKFVLMDVTQPQPVPAPAPVTLYTQTSGLASFISLAPGHTYLLAEEAAPPGYLLDPNNEFRIVLDAYGNMLIYKKTGTTPEGADIFSTAPTAPDPLTGYLVVGDHVPSIGNPVKYLDGGTVTADGATRPDYNPVLGDLPYLMGNSQEILNFSIEVPVASPEGYQQLIIADYLDPYLSPIFGSWRTYIKETGAVVSGIYDITSSSMRFIKSDEFTQIPPNSTLVLEFQARMNVSLETLYARSPGDGTLRNSASVSINRGALQYSNTVYAKAQQGTFTMTKTIEGAPMPETLHASFALYRVVGLVDGTGSPDSTDLLIDDYPVMYDPITNGGQSILTVANLELGQYYLKELNAPAGYVTLQGPLPENLDGSFGFSLTADSDGNAVPAVFTIDNKTASAPTINKQISSSTRTTPSALDYQLSMGEIVKFWLNVSIPDPMDAAGSMVIRDPLSPWLQIQGISVYRGTDPASLTLDTALTDRTRVNFLSNTVTLALSGSEVAGGETISLQIDVRVLPNTNLYEAGALENGRLVNIGYLDYTDGTGAQTTDTSTVHLDPIILRDLKLTKVLGDYVTPLSGARFTLTQQGVPDGQTPMVYIADSNTDGTVLFNDVREGTYRLHETRYPAGYLPSFVLMNEGAIVTIGMDIVFQMPPTYATLTPDPELGYVIPNNEKISLSGTKTWDDLNNQRLSRPDEYVLLLRRNVLDGTSEEGTLDGQFGRHLTLPSTTLGYTFVDTVTSSSILKYQPNTFYPFKYYIQEDPVPAGYTAVYDGMNVTNRLKMTGALPIIKVDGDSPQTMLPGIAFQLTSTTRNPDGSPVYQQQLTTDAGGRLEFTGLNPGLYAA